jgi:hypothetical protein
MRVQLNTRVEKAVRQKVIRDRSGIATNDIIVEVALEDFFTRHTPTERQRFYQNHDRKAYGRK